VDAPTIVAARALWTPSGLLTDATVVLHDGWIAEVRPWRAGDGDRVDGLVVPGLINAHTHTELSHLAGKVKGTTPGFVPWLDALWAVGAVAGQAGARASASASLHDHGTAYVVDVSNAGDTAADLASAHLRGVVQHERLGFDARTVPTTIASLTDEPAGAPGVVVRAAPHALFSTAPELVVACVRAGPKGVPSTIHVGEAEDEARFLMSGDGPHAELLDRLGREWRGWPVPGVGPIDVLSRLGVLGPDLLLVHGVLLDHRAVLSIAFADAPVCFCPRSNLHVGGRLPDVPSYLTAGVRCALGTDSLASSPDLDVLGEIPVLAAAFPDVPVSRWLAMVTHEGAAALRATGVGKVAVGARPGLLQLDVGRVEDLGREAPARRWIVAP
jgi:cytosine/adenosine deaminase-related metal-dependent hydrolase